MDIKVINRKYIKSKKIIKPYIDRELGFRRRRKRMFFDRATFFLNNDFVYHRVAQFEELKKEEVHPFVYKSTLLKDAGKFDEIPKMYEKLNYFSELKVFNFSVPRLLTNNLNFLLENKYYDEVYLIFLLCCLFEKDESFKDLRDNSFAKFMSYSSFLVLNILGRGTDFYGWLRIYIRTHKTTGIPTPNKTFFYLIIRGITHFSVDMLFYYDERLGFSLLFASGFNLNEVLIKNNFSNNKLIFLSYFLLKPHLNRFVYSGKVDSFLKKDLSTRNLYEIIKTPNRTIFNFKDMFGDPFILAGNSFYSLPDSIFQMDHEGYRLDLDRELGTGYQFLEYRHHELAYFQIMGLLSFYDEEFTLEIKYLPQRYVIDNFEYSYGSTYSGYIYARGLDVDQPGELDLSYFSIDTERESTQDRFVWYETSTVKPPFSTWFSGDYEPPYTYWQMIQRILAKERGRIFGRQSNFTRRSFLTIYTEKYGGFYIRKKTY